MKHPKNIAKEASKTLDEFYKSNPILSEVEKIVHDLSERPLDMWNPSYLTEMLAQLSILKVNLGDIVAKAMLEYNSAYAYRKYRASEAYFALKDEFKTVSDTDKQSVIETTGEHELQIKKNYQADRLKSYYDDISHLIMAIQSILNVRRDEMRESNMQGGYSG